MDTLEILPPPCKILTFESKVELKSFFEAHELERLVCRAFRSKSHPGQFVVLVATYPTPEAADDARRAATDVDAACSRAYLRAANRAALARKQKRFI